MHESTFEIRDNYRCTTAGLELLAVHPTFLREILPNPTYRTLWNHAHGKAFTKIAYSGQTYIEKTGTSWNEFHPYLRMQRLIDDKELVHTHVATPLFGNERSIVLPFYPRPYDPRLAERNTLQPNVHALEELWELLATGISMDYCLRDDGDIIVIDPHA